MQTKILKLKKGTRLTREQYAGLYQQIKPYVSFKFSVREIKKLGLSSTDKKLIRHYYREISELKKRPNQEFRTRKKSELKTAQEFSRQPELKFLKVAFIPTDGKKAKIKFNKKGKLNVTLSRRVKEEFVPLDKKKLARDPKGHVNDAIRDYDARKTRFKINAGKYVINQAKIKSQVGQEVARLCATYDTKEANNYFGNWLNGLTAFTFHGQKDFRQFEKEFEKARLEKLGRVRPKTGVKRKGKGNVKQIQKKNSNDNRRPRRRK